MNLQTEFEFTLPKGYIDKDGNLHRSGVMRLANAKDEILPLQDPRVQRNEAYLIVILLSRVVTKLGELREINPGVIEDLFASDLTFLQDFYNEINGHDTSSSAAVNGHGGANGNGARYAGGIVRYPLNEMFKEVAFLAYHFHWSREEILDLAHVERRLWAGEISRINDAMNEEIHR